MSRVMFLAALMMSAPAYAQARYFSALPDLPMPPGFLETDTALGFDDARSRLVVADAIGAENPSAVRLFYAQSLPALGWSPSPTNDASLVFVRGRERLLLELSERSGHTHLHLQMLMRAPPSEGD